jgi:predicted metal-binding protein
MNIAIVGCGSYMSSGYGCPGEWRCLKAAALGEGKFSAPVNVTSFVRCECPGRATVNNVALALKQSDVKVDAIHLSSCMVKPKPDCPSAEPDEWARLIEQKTGLSVVQETHDYH